MIAISDNDMKHLLIVEVYRKYYLENNIPKVLSV